MASAQTRNAWVAADKAEEATSLGIDSLPDDTLVDALPIPGVLTAVVAGKSGGRMIGMPDK